MAGLYIHIPFCRSRCIYCGFFSTTPSDWCSENRQTCLDGRAVTVEDMANSMHQRYVEALVKEMRLRRHENTAPITTLYMGGGTPSCLTAAQLHQLLTAAADSYDVRWDEAEVTVECNPDDVTPAFAQALHGMGVNRVSMGAQTLSDERLRWLNRRHTARQTRQAVDSLRQAGIDNVSLDLMYGFPMQTLQQWMSDVDGIIALKPEHVSAYALSYEEGTPLARLVRDNTRRPIPAPRYMPVDEETERAMYETLIDRLTAAGFEHYEISNFAQPQRRSRHNSSYWTGTPYLGIGAAAHSYDGHRRQWNISDLKRYMEALEQGRLLAESEDIDPQTRYNERVMLALRTSEGLNMNSLSDSERNYCLSHARKFIDSGLLTIGAPSDDKEDRCAATDHSLQSAKGQNLQVAVGGDSLQPATGDCYLRLTRRGLFVSDMIISELFTL